MAKSEEITFEVLVLIGSRWEAQGVYKAKELNTAITDAKSLEKVSTIKAVKVVKEFYDEKLQSSRSQTIYESKIKGEPERKAPPPKVNVKARPQSQSKAGKSKSTGSGGSPTDDMVSAAVNDGPKRPSILSALLQMVLSLVAAALTALVVTQLATMSMGNMQSIGFVSRNDFLILVFILVFAITALALITRILTKLKRLAPNLPSLSLGGSARAPKQRPKTSPYLGKPHAPAVNDAEAQPEPTSEVQPTLEVQPEEKPEEEKAPQDEMSRPDDLLSEVIAMNAFTTDVVDVIKGEENKRDAHTVFGVVLFLVGAAQALRVQKKLTDHTYQHVIFQTLGSLGLSKERAQHFVEHTDEYLISNARYSQMFQSGRNAMSANLESGVGPRGALVDSLDDWDKPKAKIENQQPVTVLFTDIAGSTAMTQKLGDAGAQEVVHVHNVIVRDAIRTFAGREIKHTGDGIMASFPNAVAGVEAARDMQRHTKAHNLAHPELPLGLKIGLNAGDPIAEDDDLFGTTVQLAARIVDKAKAGQILVSGSVHGLSQGKNLRFERFGDLEMKGFDESMTVYLAPWDDTLEPPVTPATSAAQSSAVSGAAPTSPPVLQAGGEVQAEPADSSVTAAKPDDSAQG